ncbi:hypothetical protein HMPREF3038_01976 [Akkermansia sp. KLE1797]|nr:hypothetical protein HMPREF3038_01976 [Akkermansia sp. KLE1797]
MLLRFLVKGGGAACLFPFFFRASLFSSVEHTETGFRTGRPY